MKCSVASPGQGAEDSDQEDTRGTERAPDAVAPDAALHKELVHPVAVRVANVGHHGQELVVERVLKLLAQSGGPSSLGTMLEGAGRSACCAGSARSPALVS